MSWRRKCPTSPGCLTDGSLLEPMSFLWPPFSSPVSISSFFPSSLEANTSITRGLAIPVCNNLLLTEFGASNMLDSNMLPNGPVKNGSSNGSLPSNKLRIVPNPRKPPKGSLLPKKSFLSCLPFFMFHMLSPEECQVFKSECSRN